MLVAIVKKELHLDGSLYRMLQICSVTLFEKTPILQALSLADDQTNLDDLCKQLILFNKRWDSTDTRYILHLTYNIP